MVQGVQHQRSGPRQQPRSRRGALRPLEPSSVIRSPVEIERRTPIGRSTLYGEQCRRTHRILVNHGTGEEASEVPRSTFSHAHAGHPSATTSPPPTSPPPTRPPDTRPERAWGSSIPFRPVNLPDVQGPGCKTDTPRGSCEAAGDFEESTFGQIDEPANRVGVLCRSRRPVNTNQRSRTPVVE